VAGFDAEISFKWNLTPVSFFNLDLLNPRFDHERDSG